MHHFVRQFRGLPILWEKCHLTPLALRLFENFDAPVPGGFLAVVDFPKVEHLPLHDTPRGTPSVLHNALVAMLLAILHAKRAAQKHAAIVHGLIAAIKGWVFTTTTCREGSTETSTLIAWKPPKIGKINAQLSKSS